MKGTIVKCLEDMVKAKAGPEKWKAILEKAGHSPVRMFTTIEAVPDGEVTKLIGAAAEVLRLTAQQAMDAFGDYWSTTYAPGIYAVYFQRAKSAKAFLLSLDGIHTSMTKSMKDAAPPHFRYEDPGPRELIMHYSSPRGLVALMPGLIQGVGRYYKEKVSVSRVGNSLHITFG